MAQGAPKASPFAQVYGPWIDDLARRGLRGIDVLVFLKLCVAMRPDGKGGYRAWYPAAALAEELHVSKNSVRNAIQRLKAGEFIRQTEAAHSGHTAVYAIMPSHKWPDAEGAKAKRRAKARAEAKAEAEALASVSDYL